MPKRKDAKDAKASNDGLQKSDAEILKERRSIDAFEYADSFIGFVGWALWALAGVWFFVFSPSAPEVPCLHASLGDGLLGLVVSGTLCSALSGCSPKATWSSWRKLWHLAWCVALGVLAAAFGWASTSFATPVPRGMPRPPGTMSTGVAAACALAAVGSVTTLPSGEAKPNRGVGLVPSRLLCLADGIGGFIIGASSFVAAPWDAPFGPAATVLQAVPLLMCSLALMLCQTEAELLAAVPVAVLLLSGAAARGLLLSGDVASALPMAVACLLHASLYLPLPLQDPDSNPFSRSRVKKIDSFVKFMQQPVSGFGDEND